MNANLNLVHHRGVPMRACIEVFRWLVMDVICVRVHIYIATPTRKKKGILRGGNGGGAAERGAE